MPAFTTQKQPYRKAFEFIKAHTDSHLLSVDLFHSYTAPAFSSFCCRAVARYWTCQKPSDLGKTFLILSSFEDSILLLLLLLSLLLL